MNKGFIHHIEINVSNINKTIEFWGWLLEELGYEPYQIWQEGRSWKLENTYLVFVQAEEVFLSNSYHRKNIGLNHLAFYVENKEEVDEWTNKLKEKNIKILYEDRHPFAGGDSHYAVFFEDPDRIKVELVAK